MAVAESAPLRLTRGSVCVIRISVRENLFQHIFRFQKKMTFYEMVYQKVVKVVSKSLVPLLRNEFTYFAQ